jgi:hypothetical protein
VYEGVEGRFSILASNLMLEKGEFGSARKVGGEPRLDRLRSEP